MNFRFYIDPDTEQPHIYKHDVDENEVKDVMLNALEHRPGRDGARLALGQTRGGRYLRVVYKPDDYPPDSFFIITAFDIRGNELRSLRRRQRRRG